MSQMAIDWVSDSVLEGFEFAVNEMKVGAASLILEGGLSIQRPSRFLQRGGRPKYLKLQIIVHGVTGAYFDPKPSFNHFVIEDIDKEAESRYRVNSLLLDGSLVLEGEISGVEIRFREK